MAYRLYHSSTVRNIPNLGMTNKKTKILMTTRHQQFKQMFKINFKKFKNLQYNICFSKTRKKTSTENKYKTQILWIKIIILTYYG